MATCFPGRRAENRLAGGRPIFARRSRAVGRPHGRPAEPRPSERQRERNVELLAEIVRRDEHRLRGQARRHAELQEDVDDALQSAYALFLERYKGVGEPLAWLYTTVKREAWAIRRRGSRKKECAFARVAEVTDVDLAESLPADAPGSADRVERRETRDEQRRALAALKRDELRALWLLGLGLSYAEICEATGWTYTKACERQALPLAGVLARW